MAKIDHRSVAVDVLALVGGPENVTPLHYAPAAEAQGCIKG